MGLGAEGGRTAAMSDSLFDLDGKIALVTGGSRGIGVMLAQGLARAGARVYVCSRDGEACEQNAAAIRAEGHDCHAFAADLSTSEGIAAATERFRAAEDRLHILVNNAGATWGAPFEDYPDAAFDRVFTLNVKAIFRMVASLAPLLRAAATPADPARVINIGSVEGTTVPGWENYAYPASKAAVAMLSRQLASRLAAEHITVNVIAPGLFPSRMSKFVFDDAEELEEFEAQIPLGRAGEADDIAGAGVFLASRAGAYLTGTVIAVDGGLSGARGG
jgi:NAD(P)-dependent dehydrogenase (short-subunit alcohol dehydrogenase family)